MLLTRAVRIVVVCQQAQLVGKVILGVAVRDAYCTPTTQRFDRQKKIRRVFPFVVVALTDGLAPQPGKLPRKGSWSSWLASSHHTTGRWAL